MEPERAAWLAGIIEGEGSIIWQSHHDGRCSAASIRVGMTDLDVIERLREWSGVGTIFTEKNRPDGRKPLWRWTVAKQKDVLDLFDAIEPYLLSRRGSRLREVRTLLVEYRSIPRAQRADWSAAKRIADAVSSEP